MNVVRWSPIARNNNQTQVNSLHLDHLGMGMSSSKAELQDAKMPTWTQSEVASSESEPQQIPPEQHGKVFSWTDVKGIIGLLP